MKTKYFGYLIIVVLFLSGCNTGIENTKTIKMSKSEMKATRITEEERFMSDLRPPLLNEWERGKKFLITDERASLVFDISNYSESSDSVSGHVIEYLGIEEKTTPAGGKETVVVFQDGKRILRFPTGKNLKDAESTILSMDIPMLIDLDMVEAADKMLKNKKVWTRTNLWYTPEGAKMNGLQFVSVVIDSVSPGTMVFPLKLNMKDSEGKDFVLFMNLKNTGIESRTFQNLFTLSDPKLKYTFVQPDNWSYIERGEVRIGMTKAECKLSLGNPSDVNSGHDWNSTIELWQYPNGTFLRFEDGVMIGFRN